MEITNDKKNPSNNNIPEVLLPNSDSKTKESANQPISFKKYSPRPHQSIENQLIYNKIGEEALLNEYLKGGILHQEPSPIYFNSSANDNLSAWTQSHLQSLYYKNACAPSPINNQSFLSKNMVLPDFMLFNQGNKIIPQENLRGYGGYFTILPNSHTQWIGN